MPTSSQASLGAAFLQWMRESVHYRGLRKTTAYLVSQLREMVVDSLPERRRMRFGDIDFDCDFRVDTTWARLPFKVRLREILSERQYQPTVPYEFQLMMERMEIDFRDFTFIDLGSGKGRALLLASEYPFRRIIGVELQPELHDIAEQNIRAYHSPTQQCHDIQSYAADARDFTLPDEPLVIYLFNPFPEYVIRTVTEIIDRSIRQHPRPVFVIYNTPECGFVLNTARSLRRAITTDTFSIYVARGC
ncbi:MAG TPA: class I SAM-dependent methyltransferase [Clostridia bacterium]|nr:class I SAM-dependent methyltransferase [Clostridia bacterium]